MTSTYKIFVYIVICSNDKQFGFNAIDLVSLAHAHYQTLSGR